MTLFRDFPRRRAFGHVACLTLGVAALAIAAPVGAQPSESAGPSAGAGESGGASGSASRRSRADGDRRICVMAAHTGTRVPRRICKTQAEWDAEGGLEMERLR